MLSCQELVRLSEAQLAELEPAARHLACAMGLPGSWDLDCCWPVIDDWARLAQERTERVRGLFEAQPERFKHSFAYFRMLVMVTVLQRELGVRASDKLNAPNHDLSDARDLFLHGILQGKPGTCSSLPYLYAAIGQRLGYPFWLISRPYHLYLRWEDNAEERFNIETTSTGLVTPPDEYYLTWPFPQSERTTKLAGIHWLRRRCRGKSPS